MAGGYTQENRAAKLTTDLGDDALLLVKFTCTERLSESYTVTIEAISRDPQPLHTLLGTDIGVTVAAAEGDHVNRDFGGVLWEYSEIDDEGRGHRYQLILRPRTEFMTLNRRNRIFQNQSVADILKTVLIGNPAMDLALAYDPVEYCVQYQESDFAFCSRLMEYEGLYYYYEHTGATSRMVVVDTRNAHSDLTVGSVDVMLRDDRRPGGQIWSVTERRGIGPAKLTVSDYDFEKPSNDLTKSRSAPDILGAPTDRSQRSESGTAGDWSGAAEVFDWPGKYSADGLSTGQRYGDNWLDAQRRRMARTFADGTLFAAAVGRRVKLVFGSGIDTEYLIVGTTHDYAAPSWASDTASSFDGGEGGEQFLCSLELMPAVQQYRPSQVTPRPRIMGPQTALVVGPSGEEIHTDKYGRIKVQFHWDRDGKKDENSSCFVRVVQSGVAGQGWGSFMLPRMGQEVVVEFLDGDPDRPLVTGAVYNADNMAPMPLPDNKTQFGLRTRITKGGGGHNHYWIEDKKGSEVVWFRAERDYKANIVNQDEERQYDKGHRTTLFKAGNDTKTLDAGNLTTLIAKGDETRTIDKGKRTTTIEMDETLEIRKGSRTETIKMGDDTLEVSMGNRAATIKMGNDSLKVSLGNVDIKVDLGKHSTTAMQAIELTCGPSKFKMDPMQISMEAMMIKIEAKTIMQLKGLMIQSEASAIHIVKGGLVLIN